MERETHRESEYNEGSFQMIRCHEVQTRLHQYKLNLSGWNLVYGDYNYNLLFSDLNNLFAEGSEKFSEPEIKKCSEWKAAIEKLMETHPPHETVKKVFGHKKIRLDQLNLKTLTEMLFQYELKIREFRDKHGLTSPTSKGRMF